MMCMATGNNETDRVALLHIRAKITDDPLRVLDSWNDSLSATSVSDVGLLVVGDIEE